MVNRFQRTIGGSISLEGVGLHTGKKSRVEFHPAAENTGIIFFRRDISPEVMIKADLYAILDPNKFPRRTSIGDKGFNIYTIEHVMAALSILGIDNVRIDVWGEEMPGMDGSAKEFIDAIKKVGIREQKAPRKYLELKESFSVNDGTSKLIALPSLDFRVTYILDYNNPLIGTQFVDFIINDCALAEDISQARTFCLEDEVKILTDKGLGKGANYTNTVVIGKERIINNNLRIKDECAKHKVLDLIGDLYLIGPLKAHIIGIKSGHRLNFQLLEKLRSYKERVNLGGVRSPSFYIPQDKHINITEIMKILPHRYPFLLVDKIVYLESGKKAVGIKNVSVNEHFFQGHFPSQPVMPGVLIIEAMAQVGGIIMLSCVENRNKLAYFMAADKIKFRRTVVPGDQLVIEVEVKKVRSKTGVVGAKAFIEGKVAAQGDLMFTLVEE